MIKATDVIDLIIEILRGSKNVKDARACLTDGITDNINFKSEQSKRDAAKLRFTERQTTAILEMRLQKLIGLELEALLKDHDETLKISQNMRIFWEAARLWRKSSSKNWRVLRKSTQNREKR